MTDTGLILQKLDALADEVRKLRKQIAKLMNDAPGLSTLMTIRECAAEYRIAASTLYKMKHLHTKVGRSVRIRRRDMENFLKVDRFTE
jgi:hypothetical protein